MAEGINSDIAGPNPSRTVNPPWSEDDEWLRCTHVRDETHDVKSFYFCAEGLRSFRFRPGQYMTFTLPVGEQTIFRCYTMSSAPTRPDRFSITVKRVPGGPASNWLHDHMRPGMRVSARGPGGDFSCFAPGPGAASSRLLFLSGGSGITPVMSMARAFNDLTIDVDLAFVHAARTPQDLIFEPELQLMAHQLPRFRFSEVCETRGRSPSYSGLLGRINLPTLQSVVPDFLERDVYCCGPAPFMAAIRAMLEGAGYDMARYRQESFNFEDQALAAPEPAVEVDIAGVGASFEVQLKRRGARFRCRPDQTLLQAATEAGFRMPSSCTQGLCGTCRTMKVSGEVDMQQAGALRAREVAQGWVLPCCSRPKADVVLDA